MNRKVCVWNSSGWWFFEFSRTCNTTIHWRRIHVRNGQMGDWPTPSNPSQQPTSQPNSTQIIIILHWSKYLSHPVNKMVAARVIGYIPLDRGIKAKTRISHLLGEFTYVVYPYLYADLMLCRFPIVLIHRCHTCNERHWSSEEAKRRRQNIQPPR